jgi:tetratricopeptide (TPR) repeat protein
MKRPTNPRHLLRSLVGFCLLPLALVAADAELTQAFRNALKDVDRIVLNNTEAHPGAKPGILMEFQGSELVQSMGATVEVERRTDHCLCITSPAIQLYAGEQLRFSLTLHHSTRLRDENGPWMGDVKLTEESAKQFRAWFSERGYHGFVEDYDAMLQAQKEYQEQWAAILSLFPDGGAGIPEENEYPSHVETNRRIESLRAKFHDPASRITVCWRGLGRLNEWARYRHHPAQRFMLEVLKLETTEDIRAAMAALSDTDGYGWIGAYLHHEEGERQQKFENEHRNIINAVDEETRTRMVRQKLNYDRDPLTQFTITKLRHHDGPQVRALLVEIAEGRHPGPPTEQKFLQNDYWALHTLAELKDARAADLAAAKLKDTSLERKTKLALEVIRARFDGRMELGMEHLTETDSSAAGAAWEHMKNHTQQWPIESWLIVAEKTSDFDVKRAAEAMLAKRGLRLMKDEDRMTEAWAQYFPKRLGSHEDTLTALAEVEAMPVDQDRGRLRSSLLARIRLHVGRHLLNKGDYEAARSSLIQADEKEAEAKLVIVNLATGRLDEAQMHAWRSLGLGAGNAEQLSRRAFVAFARGDFEDAARDFDAATRLNPIEESTVLFAHMAHVLSGMEVRSHLPAWTNPMGKWVLVDEDGEVARYWPETGILHLQGKMSWAELVAGVEGMRGDERAEAWFGLAVMCRIRGETAAEKTFLERAIATKEFQSIGYVLALLRMRELLKSGG